MKALRLCIWGNEHPVLLGSRGMVANECLRDYWRDDLRVLSNPIVTMLLRPFSWTGPSRRHLYPLDVELAGEDGKISRGLAAYDDVFSRYHNKFGPAPILTIKPDHRERGRKALDELGVPADAWFVLLHVREPGFINRNEIRKPREVDMSEFREAVRFITERGGWVIRLGHPSMSPFEPMENVFDHALSNSRSPEMDIFLLAECRFLLGTDSGPIEVTSLFGKPNAIVGMLPISARSHHFGDVYLPGMLRSQDDGRILTFPEIMKSHVRSFITEEDFASARLDVIRPSAGMIRRLTSEVLDRLEGNATYDDADVRLQEQWRELLFYRKTPFTRGALSRVSRDFLRHHQALL